MIPKKLILKREMELLQSHFVNDIVGEDRRLRFGITMSDDAVLNYVSKAFDFYGTKNMWFIVEDGPPGNERVIASCHSYYDETTNTVELGLTVSPDYRNKKIGQELYNRGVIWARSQGAETIFMHCLSENKTIQHIAKKFGMTVVTHEYGEKESVIKVNKNPHMARWEDTVMENMAVYDETIRKQGWFIKNFMKAFIIK